MANAFDTSADDAGLVRHQLFFALLPDEAARAQIVKLAKLLKQVRQSYAPLIEPQNLHLSLFYVDGYRGDPPHDVIGKARRAGAAIRAAKFEVAFNLTASFATKTPRHPFVLLGDESPVLQALRKEIALAMRKHGLAYAVKAVNSFTPHLTLWWDTEMINAQPILPIAWTARVLVLIDSLQGLGKHEYLARWPLI